MEESFLDKRILEKLTIEGKSLAFCPLNYYYVPGA
jgi:hypothetical protein